MGLQGHFLVMTHCSPCVSPILRSDQDYLLRHRKQHHFVLLPYFWMQLVLYLFPRPPYNCYDLGYPKLWCCVLSLSSMGTPAGEVTSIFNILVSSKNSFLRWFNTVLLKDESLSLISDCRDRGRNVGSDHSMRWSSFLDLSTNFWLTNGVGGTSFF